MPNRIIKESICTSETVAGLSWFEQCLFFRLIVLADDFGRFDARAPIIKGKGFPLSSVTEKQIGDAMSKLVTAGIVDLYEVGGKPYLQLKTWANHQQIRNKKSKYPSPDDCGKLIANDINCNQLIAIAPVIQSNPIQSESESESESESNPNNTIETRFDVFWSAYPRKTGKGAAEKAFLKYHPSQQLLESMLQALSWQKESTQWKRDGGQYIPLPTTWLNQKRWEDEAEKPKTFEEALDEY